MRAVSASAIIARRKIDKTRLWTKGIQLSIKVIRFSINIPGSGTEVIHQIMNIASPISLTT